MTVTERRVGRPRDESVSSAITEAVLSLMADVGVAEMSVDAIAAHAGVSKASIYRRWGSKEDLIVDVIGGLVSQVEITSTGDIRMDLLLALDRVGSFLSEFKAGSIFPRLVAEVHCGSALGRHYAEAVILPKRAMLGRLVEEAKDRGELRADLDVDLAVDMLTGPVMLRKLMGPYRKPDPGVDAKLVDALLDGWR